MSINAVQFQAGVSMPEFFAAYGTEVKCYRALYKWRWPQGLRCPSCAGRARSRFKRGGAIYYQCSACRHQASLIAGTMFQGTKLPTAHLDAGLAPVDLDQDQHGRAGADASSGHQLQERLADEA